LIEEVKQIRGLVSAGLAPVLKDTYTTSTVMNDQRSTEKVSVIDFEEVKHERGGETVRERSGGGGTAVLDNRKKENWNLHLFQKMKRTRKRDFNIKVGWFSLEK
jgi:hypothetical protein